MTCKPSIQSLRFALDCSWWAKGSDFFPCLKMFLQKLGLVLGDIGGHLSTFLVCEVYDVSFSFVAHVVEDQFDVAVGCSFGFGLEGFT